MRQIFTVVFFLLLTSCASAELIFDIQLSKTDITVGEQVSVTVRVRSETSVTVGGYTANVLAGPGTGEGGTFVLGTIDFSVGDPGEFWDLLAIQGQAFTTADTTALGGTGLGQFLPKDEIRIFGTLRLDTSGAAPGNYQLSMGSLAGNSLSGGFFPGPNQGARFDPATSVVSYTITAVPEPSSLFFIAAFLGCVIALNARRSRVFYAATLAYWGKSFATSRPLKT